MCLSLCRAGRACGLSSAVLLHPLLYVHIESWEEGKQVVHLHLPAPPASSLALWTLVSPPLPAQHVRIN